MGTSLDSITALQKERKLSELMGAVFTHAPIEPRAIAIQVGKIHFDAACRYCHDGRRATTNIRPVDAIGRPIGDLNICAVHAGRLIERARAKGLAIEMHG